MASMEKVYLTGFMGSGKTTAGRKLAGRMGWEFIDLDRLVELKSGMTIPEIFSSHGETHFRSLEAETLRQLKKARNAVISTGGGVPCFSDNMEFMLSDGIVVYLKMTPAQLRERLLGSKTDRPLIKGMDRDQLLSFITTRLLEREEYYSKAHIVTDGLNIDVDHLHNLIKSFPEF